MKKGISFVALTTFLLALLSCAKGGEEEPTSSSSAPSSSITSSSNSDTHSVDLPLGDPPVYEEDSIRFHYWRKDGVYAGWDLWLWEIGHDGGAFSFNGKDDWGVVASYPLSVWEDVVNSGLGFIVRKGGDSWSQKDCGGNDLFVDFSQFEKTGQGVYDIYMITGDSNIYTDTKGTVKAKINYATFVTATRIAAYANLGIKSYKLFEDDELIVENDKVGGSKRIDVDFPTGKKVDYAANYELILTFSNGDSLTAIVTKNNLFSSDEFGSLYNYDGDDLGVIYSSSSSSFAVWSPLSNSIALRVYSSGTPAILGGDDTYREYAMSKGEKGVWRINVDGDLAGKYYTYVVTNASFKDKEIVDPYAKGCGVNGVRGMIVDFTKTNPTGWEGISPLNIDRKAMVVYETHVVDVTSSASWKGNEEARNRFAGVYQTGTTYSENGVKVSTGFDHIKELGVNAVQLLPIFDQANDEVNASFNWGYNPLNYNCLEGSYSSDPYDGYVRIKEFKTLVSEYHQAGINIIMDVVYNHVAGALDSNFDVLMPGYYFRYTSSGTLSNGSGCGNETASEHYMMRKFIADSASFWAKEYKLGGFRFDLMGLHDLETMNEVSAKAKEINPSIVIYGEPWSGGSSTLSDALSAKQINGNKYEGYGQFNDQMRDALIRGGLSADNELGWVTDQKSKISTDYINKLLKGIKGETYSGVADIADPDKSVSYVTCHDNYTLYDRVMATKSGVNEETAKKMNRLANSVVFTSQGTSFMLAGEEMLRTKGGNKNSYNASYKTNELDYSLKIKHQDLFEDYQRLIALKKNLEGLHMDKDNIKSLTPKLSDDGGLLSYSFADKIDSKNAQVRVVHKNGLSEEEKIDFDGYTILWSTEEGEKKTLNEATAIKPFETIVAYKTA